MLRTLGLVARGIREVFCGALLVEHGFAMFAHSHAGTNLFPACGTFARSLRCVGPFALQTETERGAPVHVRNLAVRMAARPHFVGFRDEPAVPAIAARAGGGELFD